jgi:hypothetical protein
MAYNLPARIWFLYLMVAVLVTSCTHTTKGPGFIPTHTPCDIITGISGGPLFNPTADESVPISYHLMQPASISIDVYGTEGVLIRRLLVRNQQEAGPHQVRWNGRSDGGEVVPDDAYFFTIEARTPSGSGCIYDPTQASGGKPVPVEDLHLDIDRRQVCFSLPTPSRVRLRLMIKQKALIATLLDWSHLSSGDHCLPLEGTFVEYSLDHSHDLSPSVVAQAFSLYENSLLTTGNERTSRLTWRLTVDPARTFKLIRFRGRDTNTLSPHFLHSWKACRDPGLHARFSQDVEPDSLGIIHLSGTMSLIVSSWPQDSRIFTNGHRCEVFLDGELVWEDQREHPLYTWMWATDNVPPGLHLLTINVPAIGDHCATHSFFVRKD